MNRLMRNPIINVTPLPVDIILSLSWWYKHEGICFDRDFFFHPTRRVEVERQMEQVLYDRWGRYGPGTDRNKNLPQIGAVHLAAGFLLSEMLGCQVLYSAGAPPQVIPADRDSLALDPDAAFQSEAFRRFCTLRESLREKYGYLVGDVNWGGVLNLAIDLRGQMFFMDVLDNPDRAYKYLIGLSQVIQRFVDGIRKETGTSSISVNRVVRHFNPSVFLHSECSVTMISAEQYEKLLLPVDREWSRRYRPFGIHFCGKDPHRFAAYFARLPHLDFLDVGWGGDVKTLRQALPDTFLNLRLSPVEIINQSDDDIHRTIVRLVRDSGNPYLTGICCINMDDQVTDENISAIFETVEELRGPFIKDQSGIVDPQATREEE
ncbi:MAG: hypothetical protein DRP66_02635 [Planctomycetota bacterium]|nr:MAG: hypothetical protein DRP66_02635 [Planctomycetota bacterium]